MAVTSGHHAASRLSLVHTRPGHPLVTSGTRPPAGNCSDECPESPASSILRFKVGKCMETRTTQSAVFCAINFLVLKCLSEEERKVHNHKEYFTSDCDWQLPILGHSLLSKTAFKKSLDQNSFHFLCENYRKPTENKNRGKV